VIVPERNQHDLDDVPSDVRDRMQFHIVSSVDQVLAVALAPSELAMAA
jgi:ATP-dependent Lon protease